MLHGGPGKKKEAEKIRRLKASKSFLNVNSNEFYNIRHIVAFPAVGGISSCPKGTNFINN